MKSKFLAGLEKGLVLVLLASFALPLTLGLWVRYAPKRSLVSVWLRRSAVYGAQVKPEPVALSRATVLAAKFQAAYAADYDSHFATRDVFIRVINEIYLRVFRTSQVGVLVGPHLSLTESIYALEYCRQRGDREALRPFVENLRRVQDFCDARGLPFALLITPSKASIYPETLPAEWRRRYRPEPRYYDNFLPLLRELGIRYVDGHRITADLKPTARVPLFPRGGIHWGDPAALATVNALLALLAREGLAAQPIQHYTTEFSDRPGEADADLVKLLNVVFRQRYPVANVTVQPVDVPFAGRPNMVLVGGSFLYKALDLLDASGQFSELEFYRYYSLGKSCHVNGELHKVASPTPPVDFEREVFAADALVVEVNEQTLHDPHNLADFLRDALAALPDPHAARAPFHYQGRLAYQWGDTLSFVAGANLVNLAATRGFGAPDPLGSYTLGPVASIRFQAPPPGDMVLEVNASAFIVDRRLPEQRVGVYANGRFVGEMVWTKQVLSRHDLPIPQACLDGGEVLLEFRIARPGSPSEFGLGGDTHKYGILLSSLRLRGCPETVHGVRRGKQDRRAKSGFRLFHRHALGQVARLVHVAAQ